MPKHSGLRTGNILKVVCTLLTGLALIWVTSVLLLTRQHAWLAALMGGVAIALAFCARRAHCRHKTVLCWICLAGLAACLLLGALALIALPDASAQDPMTCPSPACCPEEEP